MKEAHITKLCTLVYKLCMHRLMYNNNFIAISIVMMFISRLIRNLCNNIIPKLNKVMGEYSENSL